MLGGDAVAASGRVATMQRVGIRMTADIGSTSITLMDRTRQASAQTSTLEPLPIIGTRSMPTPGYGAARRVLRGNQRSERGTGRQVISPVEIGPRLPAV